MVGVLSRGADAQTGVILLIHCVSWTSKLVAGNSVIVMNDDLGAASVVKGSVFYGTKLWLADLGTRSVIQVKG